MVAMPEVNSPPAGWFVLEVMRRERHSWHWVVLMIDVDPDEYCVGYRTARSCLVRIPGKHRSRDAAWDRFEEMVSIAEIARGGARECRGKLRPAVRSYDTRQGIRVLRKWPDQ
jgi:hypothetical protein